MSTIIGREEEEKELERAYQSNQAELIAIYGRRRVGKTYLVERFFERKKKEALLFYATGTKDAPQHEQTKNFSTILATTFFKGAEIRSLTTWQDAFWSLTQQIRLSESKRIVIFLDEFPWMITRGSRFLRTFEYFWNQYWVRDPRIKLIICGSSSGWILKNIVNNTGGLYNRVTLTIHLEPFNLAQTKAFLSHNKVTLSLRDIVDLYMVFGGIPFYLSKVKPGRSVTEIIDELAFSKNSFLLNEFENLYATLFGSEDVYSALMRVIANHRYGIGQEQLAAETKDFSSGGRLVDLLKNLEHAGFISKLYPYKQKKGIYYVVSDEYSLFYFKWIEPIKRMLLQKDKEQGLWRRYMDTPSWNSWAGYSFEAVCYKHVDFIRRALRLDSLTLAATWRYIPPRASKKSGAQIDLLFDRADNAITVCEIKYTREAYVFDKEAYEDMINRISLFKEHAKVKDTLFIALVSASGIKKTRYTEELITGVVTLEDLFKHS